jgi:uncharacterized membrane protein
MLHAMFKLSTLPTLVKLHPRLLLAAAVGLLTGWALTTRLEPLQSAVLGWNIGVWLYLVMIWILIVRADVSDVKAFAEQEDESATMVLFMVCIAAIASLAAIVLQLGTAKDLHGAARALHYTVTVMTVLGSWFLVGTIFAVHYTKLFYIADDNALPLKFPDEKNQPDYWDFLYFAFTISAAVQTSDVAVMTTSMRKVVLGHTVLAFLFNAAILGLSINIAAGLIGT